MHLQTKLIILAQIYLIALFQVFGSAPSRADDEEARAAAAIATQQPSSVAANTWKLGDYTVNWRPYIETEGGVDTNPDNLFNEDGSGLLKIEGGMKTTLERSNEYYALTLRGRFIDFRELGEDPHRKDFRVGLETRQYLSEKETLSAGSYFLRDMISFDEVDIYHSYVEYALREETYRIRLSGKNHTERNFDNTSQGDDDFDDFVVSRPRAFDYARSDGQISALTFANGMLQPFVIYDFGHINYYSQVSSASIDRDAIEQFGVAGIRFQFDPNFRVDVGYRYNTRDFDDGAIGQRDTDFIDINVFWKPTDTFKLTAVVERYFDESTTSFGYVDDVQTYGVTFDWDLALKWRLAGTAFFDRELAIGDDARYDKLTTTLSLSYYMNENLELFTSGLAKWVDEDFSGDEYERFKIGSGARLKF